jgi:hypothetical protein
MLLQYRDDISYRIVQRNIQRYGFNHIHQHNNDRSHVSALGLISTFDCSVRLTPLSTIFMLYRGGQF